MRACLSYIPYSTVPVNVFVCLPVYHIIINCIILHYIALYCIVPDDPNARRGMRRGERRRAGEIDNVFLLFYLVFYVIQFYLIKYYTIPKDERKTPVWSGLDHESNA